MLTVAVAVAVTVTHDALLQPLALRESLINSDTPAITMQLLSLDTCVPT